MSTLRSRGFTLDCISRQVDPTGLTIGNISTIELKRAIIAFLNLNPHDLPIGKKHFEGTFDKAAIADGFPAPQIRGSHWTKSPWFCIAAGALKKSDADYIASWLGFTIHDLWPRSYGGIEPRREADGADEIGTDLAIGQRLASVIGSMAVADAAKIAGCSSNTMRRWMAGDVAADAKALARVSGHFDKSLRWLLTGIDDHSADIAGDLHGIRGFLIGLPIGNDVRKRGLVLVDAALLKIGAGPL